MPSEIEYARRIARIIKERFPNLTVDEVLELAEKILNVLPVPVDD